MQGRELVEDLGQGPVPRTAARLIDVPGPVQAGRRGGERTETPLGGAEDGQRARVVRMRESIAPVPGGRVVRVILVIRMVLVESDGPLRGRPRLLRPVQREQGPGQCGQRARDDDRHGIRLRADLGDYREALADLDEALGLGLDRDDEIDVRSARALALAGLGRLDEAEAEIDAALAMDPDRPRSRVRRGRIAELAGRAAQARSDLEQVLRRGSGPAPVEVRTARRILERLSAQG